MIYFVRRVLRDIGGWPRSLQATVLVSVGLLLALTIVIFGGPPELRLYACIGALGVVAVLQAAILFAYRDMVSPLVRAQRLYVDGDLDGARDTLEAMRSGGKADYRALTLLGNTYRQLGDLPNSHAALSEALNNFPEHQYPLVGFGRTLLAEGQYAEAADVLRRALDAGALPIVQLDRAEALYRAGQPDEAREVLEAAAPAIDEADAPRCVMRAYLQARLAEEPVPASSPDGLAYWDAAAVRFADTPYGRDLALDIATMRGANPR